MRTKTIEKLLSEKFDKWLKSIACSTTRDILKDECIITGGAICSMLQNKDPNDYDIYFKTREAALAAAKYYIMGTVATIKKDYDHPDEGEFSIYIASDGVLKIDKNKGDDDLYRPVFMSSHAITLSDKVQLITKFYGTPDEIHDNFDFIHATNYWDSRNKRVTLNIEAVTSILGKELIYTGSRFPVCSVIRSRKFVERGWKISAGQYLKMMMQISELNLNDIATLNSQLVGVDSAYFSELIVRLEDEKKNNPTKEFDSLYVIKVIEQVFE